MVFFCFWIFSLLWLCWYLLFGTEGRPQKLKIFYKQEVRGMEVYPQEPPQGPARLQFDKLEALNSWIRLQFNRFLESGANLFQRACGIKSTYIDQTAPNFPRVDFNWLVRVLRSQAYLAHAVVIRCPRRSVRCFHQVRLIVYLSIHWVGHDVGLIANGVKQKICWSRELGGQRTKPAVHSDLQVFTALQPGGDRTWVNGG